MSANNYIHISRDNEVVMLDADTGAAYGSYTKKFDTLEEAVEYAQSVVENDVVEYGIEFEHRAAKPKSESGEQNK